jgi:transposase
MELKDIARGVPAEIWTVFEPILPPVVWCGNGRPPEGNRECFHALLYVLVSGIPWEMLPRSFPSYKTVQRRLQRWLERDAFRTAWRPLARRYEQMRGINWDQVLLDGSKKPSKKGVNRPARRRLTGGNAARRCTWPATTGPCRWGW